MPDSPFITPQEAADWLARAETPRPNQVYQHYRTRARYTVVCTSLDESDPRRVLVTYTRPTDPARTYWTREVSDFLAEVAPGVPRFRRVAF